MPTNTSEQKLVTTESEIGSNGVGHSMQGSNGEVNASPEELTLALETSQAVINQLTAENEALRKEKAEAKPVSNSDDKMTTLLELLTTAVLKKDEPVQQGPVGENINRAVDYSKRQDIDGKSLMEAQATLNLFKGERKVPIYIPKTFQNQFGPSLAVSVNGVRVSIPCDGKTYFINETHAEAARERMAKVDRLLADTEPQIIETVA